MTEWQTIETAPKDGTDIIVMYIHIDTQCVHAAFWLEDEDDPSETGWWTYKWNELGRTKMDGMYEPTHWMLLPEPPK